jgi:hypothetical protein
MNKKTLLPGILIITTVVLTGFFYLKPLKTDKRAEYDRFLAREYRKAEKLINTDKTENDKPENPELAALQNWFMTFDPGLNRVPVERLVEATKKTVQLDKQNSLKPGNMIEWSETSSDMGGRMRGIIWDPNEDNKVWACSVTGGLWYNDDITGNTSWQQVDDFWPGLATNCIAYDPGEPETFYVGTGEYQTARIIYRESSGVGYGIWKSTDAGETWEVIPSTTDFKYISDIAVNSNDGYIYAGVVSGVYHGINHISEPSDGLYRSGDNGATWEQVLPDIDGEDVPYAPADIEISSDGRIFIGTLKNLVGKGGATILYSDSGDPGSWTVYDYYETIIPNDPDYPIPGRVVLDAAPSDPGIVYAIVGAGWLNSSNFNYARGRYILRSDDGGETWTEKPLPGGSVDWASLSWHAFEVTVNPTDPDNVFVGGLDLWKSTNGGNSWNHVSDWSLMYYGGGDDYVHADQHWGRYKPGSSDIAIFSSDGGIFYSENASAAYPVFQEKSKDLSTLQFYIGDIYPVAGQNKFIGGLQDNGSLLYQGQPLVINDMVTGGDGAYCFFDETQPQYMITSTYYNSYTLFSNFNYYTSFGDNGTGVFINPCDYDSKNNILFANKCKFNGSNANKILRMAGIPNPSNSTITLGTGLLSYYTNVKVSPNSPEGTSTLFLGSQVGRLFKVMNANSSPQLEELGSDEFPEAFISCIEVGGSDDTLIATFSNYGVSKVWLTYDGGTNWNNITNNLPDVPVRWALFHPQNAKQIILATELGIWMTDDASVPDFEWEHDASFPNVRVDNLQIRKADNTLLVITHGRGLWWGTWNYNPSTQVKEITQSKFTVFPNPASGIVNVRMKNKSVTNTEIIVSDINGRTVFSKNYNTPDRENISFDMTGNAKGVYFVKIKSGGKVFSEKIILK